MKVFPLNGKKKLSRFMNWFDVGAVLILALCSFIGGIVGTTVRERYNGSGGKPETEERLVMQQKVTHLVDDFNTAQSMDRLTKATDKGADFAMDAGRADAANARVQKQFAQEEQAVGISLATARRLSSHEREELYKQVMVVQPAPAYFPSTQNDEDFLNTRHVQAKIMDKPGFTPTTASATAIVKGSTDHSGWRTVEYFLGPLGLTIAGMFGFASGRKRLDNSIYKDEEAEQKRRETELEAETLRKAADEAEAARIANIPAAVAVPIDHDISIRKLRLKGRQA